MNRPVRPLLKCNFDFNFTASVGGAHLKKTSRYTKIAKLALIFLVFLFFFWFFKNFQIGIGFFGIFGFFWHLILGL